MIWYFKYNYNNYSKVDMGIIEYIDVNESDNCLIALSNSDIGNYK
jgi:hypothetical protein